MLTLKQATDLARSFGFGSLITEPNANAKLIKSEGWYNCGITLAQASLSGHNMCAGSTKFCRRACLGDTGRAEFTPKIVESRINRTKLYATDLSRFWDILLAEMCKIDRKAQRLGLPVAFRPNILSDQPWHIRLRKMFETFNTWQFYGYTKIRSYITSAIRGELPTNYHLTYSWNENTSLDYVEKCLENGVNVAVPFYDKNTLKPTIPEKWHGWDCVNGDKSDLRFLDPPGVIVALGVKLPKSKIKREQRVRESNGFFVGV